MDPDITAAGRAPDADSLSELRSAAAGCTACPLYENATQTVFGKGPESARVILLGEQPGDQEDREGEPFIGPAGRLLDKALEEAGVDREQTYVTNTVKHFKWVPRGKRRLHQKPNRTEIKACQPWLEAEMALLKPAVVVALGATAAQGLMGSGFRVTKERGKVIETDFVPAFVATVHPSSILRTTGPDREKAFAAFVDDLRVVAGLL